MTWNLIGHDWAAGLLAGQLAAGELRHAYLFTGPQGIGRRTLSLRFAQAINCPEAEAPGRGCGACPTCLQIEKGAHPDLHVVAAEQAGGTLKVDQVRELQRSLALSPYSAAYRVALLLRFEEAHASAANALLKTLEEPPARVILLVTAQSPEAVPETILSRCQLLRLRPVPFGRLAEALTERNGIPAEDARLFAHLSGGRPGLALRLAQEPETLAQRAEWLNEHRRLLPAGLSERFSFAESAARDREALRRMAEVWATLWRDIMIASSGAGAPLTNIDRLTEIETAAARLSTGRAREVLLALESTRDRLDQNANVRLAAETLVLSLPRLA